MAAPELDARLREIVLRHTVVGGYPDTMAIAREAYALDRAPGMLLERTVWRGEVSRDEAQNLDDWIRKAHDDDLERLLNADLDMTNADDQALLARVWSDSNDDLNGLLGGREIASREDVATYHWSDGQRRAFRKAVACLRPGYLDSDPGQGGLL